MTLRHRDHKSLQHIFDQKELNMRQRRWLELFSDYEYEIKYHLGKANVVADALTQGEAFKDENVIAKGLNGVRNQDSWYEAHKTLVVLSCNSRAGPDVLLPLRLVLVVGYEKGVIVIRFDQHRHNSWKYDEDYSRKASA
ncbi:hypothetical protein Tco_0702625, partial [Tanacetum coccineum]